MTAHYEKLAADLRRDIKTLNRRSEMTKTLEDVKADMSELYEQVKAGDCDLRVAAELTNITGKFLKASQLEFAKELWLDRRSPETASLIEQ